MPISKPKECIGCVFEKLSLYITPDNILPDAEVFILDQAPGQHEENGKRVIDHEWYSGKKNEVVESVMPQPLIGPSGHWLQREFWRLTGIDYQKVSKANVIKCRPYNKNDLPSIGSNKPVNNITVTMLKEAIKHCSTQYLHINSSVKYIMAMGGISLYALTGLEGKNNGITSWRGWVLGKDIKDDTIPTMGVHDYYTPMAGSSLYTQLVDVLPVIHIASLFEDIKYYRATLSDFYKFGKLVSHKWPVALPEIKINTIPNSIPSYIGFDTEYDPYDNNRLEMWSLADVHGNIYVNDAGSNSRVTILPNTTVVTQNGLVDLPHFMDVFNVSSIILQDCMLAWAVLYPGEPANLDYMTSIVGRYNRHKHLRITNDRNTKYLYAGLDADTTLNHVWKSILKAFTQDKLSYNEYIQRRQPLLYIINKFQSKGVAIWKERVNEIASLLDNKMDIIINKAKQISGNPEFNIASNAQVEKAIYDNDFTVDNNKSNTRTSPSKRKDSTKTLSKEELLIQQLKLELGV